MFPVMVCILHFRNSENTIQELFKLDGLNHVSCYVAFFLDHETDDILVDVLVVQDFSILDELHEISVR